MQEMIVNAGRITSSPGLMSSASIAASSAAVPLQTATPHLRLTRAEKARSNFSTNGPSEEIQPVSRHSLRYLFSLPSSNGSLTAMKSVRGMGSGGNADAVGLNGLEDGLVLVAGV